ncbi:MAG: hypothetical protein JWN45_158 [Acidobacteriaceae bacterium]|nr:hypothetical protein [Acidobacteriaceae bacterium]
MRRLVIAFLCISLAAVAQTELSPAVHEFVKIESPTLALTHVRVIDGTGAAALDDQTVVIADGKIKSIGKSGSVEVPSDAKVIDLSGDSVIPGLVGMHDHMFYPGGGALFHEMGYSFPRLYLAGGVTTIRTTGSVEPYADLETKKLIDGGQMPGPKMHITGPYIEGKGTFAVQLHQLTGPDDARNTVNFWADQGATSFKIYNYVTRDEMKATNDAAHARKLTVTGHLCSVGFREAAALGIDDLEHGLVVDTEFYSGKKPDVCPSPRAALAELTKLDMSGPEIQGMIRDLVAHHVALTSTLPVFEQFVPGRPAPQRRVLDAMGVDARNDYLGARVRLSATPDSPWPQMFTKEMQFEREFVKAGGLLLAGLDPTGIGGVLAGFGDQREVELLVEAGFTPLEAIHIATANGAQFLGESQRIGTIAAGKQADLVVVVGDPSKNINDIEKVQIVFKDGVGYDPVKLTESARGLVGLR